MVDGLLGPMPNVTNPQQAATDTLMQMQQQPRMVAPTTMGVTPQRQPQQQQMTPQNLREIYGILAQTGAGDPQSLVNQYVSQARGLQQQNNPTEQFLRMYGNINPFDYDPKSIQRFHEEFVRTGQPRFDLLQERQKLSSVEEKRLFESYDRMRGAASMIGRMGNLAQQFDNLAASGQYKQGLYGSLDAWFTKAVTGGQDELSAVRQEYNAIKNAEVIKNLPPGVASDRDIAIAMEGWPPANANAAYLSAFLRGMQKMQVLVYAEALHENQYISANKSPGMMAADFMAKSDAYALQALQANGLRIDTIGGKPVKDYTAQELQDYADGRMTQMLTGGTYGGATLAPVGAGGGEEPLADTPPTGSTLQEKLEYYRRLREQRERQRQ